MGENGGVIGTLGALVTAMGAWVFWLIQANRKSDEARNQDVERRAEERVREVREFYEARLAEKEADIERERANTEAWMQVALKGDEVVKEGVLVSSAALHALRLRSK